MNLFKKGFILLLVVIMSISSLAGCSSSKNDLQNELDSKEKENTETEVSYPITIKDDFENEVVLEKEPLRILSLAPNNTEILFALGLNERIVGVSNFCDYPEEAATKEKIGDAWNINVEKIIELNPDVVFQYGSIDEAISTQLIEAGIKIVSYEPDSIQEVTNLILEIGKITNKMNEANNLAKNINDRKEEIVNKLKDADTVKVFYEIWNEPLMAAGPGSFIDEYITILKGENIAYDAEGKYPQFNVEVLIERNPDFYLSSNDVETKTLESIKNRDGYEDINAIKNDKVYLLDGNIMSRPGPRVIDALELVAKTIHPEIFK